MTSSDIGASTTYVTTVMSFLTHFTRCLPGQEYWHIYLAFIVTRSINLRTFYAILERTFIKIGGEENDKKRKLIMPNDLAQLACSQAVTRTSPEEY